MWQNGSMTPSIRLSLLLALMSKNAMTLCGPTLPGNTRSTLFAILKNEIRLLRMWKSERPNYWRMLDYVVMIEDDTFLVGDLRSTVSWSLVGQDVILYVELLNEKYRIDFKMILCPNHDVERDIITKMRNISSLNIDIMGKYRSTKVGEDIMSDQDSVINHFVSKTLSFIRLNDAYNKNLQTDVIKKYCPTYMW
jgi:hypothetical protein